MKDLERLAAYEARTREPLDLLALATLWRESPSVRSVGAHARGGVCWIDAAPVAETTERPAPVGGVRRRGARRAEKGST